jgi:hypothetical protein
MRSSHPELLSIREVSPRPNDPIRLVSRLNGSRKFRVGELFRADATRWEPDAIYNLDRDGHSLTLIEPSPSPARVRSVASRPAELALVVQSPLVILLGRFGPDDPWWSVPYAWPLRQHGQRVQIVPPARLPGHDQVLMWISLVDADTGIVVAQRGTPMIAAFARALHAAIRAQIREPFEPDAYVSAVRSIYERPVHPDELLERASARMLPD